MVEVETRKEAADWMLISDVTRFARAYGSFGRAIIISSDKGSAGHVLIWDLSPSSGL